MSGFEPPPYENVTVAGPKTGITIRPHSMKDGRRGALETGSGQRPLSPLARAPSEKQQFRSRVSTMTTTGSRAGIGGATAVGRDSWAENRAFASSIEEAARDSAAESVSTQEHVTRRTTASEAPGISVHSAPLGDYD